MADDVELPGTGQTVSTDDVGGVHYQRVKLVDGTDGGADAIPGGTDGLYVDLRTKSAFTGNKVITVVTGDDTTEEEVLTAAPRKSALILNNSDGIVYLGNDDTVSIATGVPLQAGQAMTDTTSTDAWWVIGDTDVTVDLRVIEVL